MIKVEIFARYAAYVLKVTRRRKFVAKIVNFTVAKLQVVSIGIHNVYDMHM